MKIKKIKITTKTVGHNIEQHADIIAEDSSGKTFNYNVIGHGDGNPYLAIMHYVDLIKVAEEFEH